MTARRNRTDEKLVVSDQHASISITPGARMDLYSTFRVGGPSEFLVRAGTRDEIQLAMNWALDQGLPVTVFGGGSNMLVADDGIRGLVLVVRRPGRDLEQAIEVLQQSDDAVSIRVPASAPLNWLGREASKRGWSGLTWAVGLPGNVGGAVVNNAGAHGTEFKDNLVGLRLVGKSGELIERDREWLDPEYRRTKLKSDGNPRTKVVVDVVLELGIADPAALVADADRHAEYRRATQPTGKCAGSIFKNPPDDFSGRLIEDLGLKGTRVGGAEVSPKHANFIVNENGATAADIVELVKLVQTRVYDATGIQLDTEIERVGAW